MSPVLCVTGVSKSFEVRRGRVLALEDVELSVPEGMFVAIIGPSGCGKSTLLRIIGGLVESDRGSVSIFGQSPAAATASKKIGLVPQSPALLPWRSVLDNVKLSLQVNTARRRSRDAKTPRELAPVELLEKLGLAGVLDRRPGQLSLGMQQRVAIARALVFDPAVLLMDEPFSALDELTRELQRHELLRIWQANRKTVLFVTHSVTEAVVLADAVVVMSSQPGSVRAVVPVGLSRPRGEMVETTPEFHSIELAVRHELRRAWTEPDVVKGRT